MARALIVMMSAAQFDAAWHAGRRDFHGVTVTVEPEYVEAWESVTRRLVAERERLWSEVERFPGRLGNWQLIRQMYELDELVRARLELRAAIHAAQAAA